MKTNKKLFLAMLSFLMVLFILPSSVQAAPKINKKTVYLAKGKTERLKISGYKGAITWSSANAKIAKVSSKGKIKAVSTGKTTITAEVKNKKLKCTVHVSPSIARVSVKTYHYNKDTKNGSTSADDTNGADSGNGSTETDETGNTTEYNVATLKVTNTSNKNITVKNTVSAYKSSDLLFKLKSSSDTVIAPGKTKSIKFTYAIQLIYQPDDKTYHSSSDYHIYDADKLTYTITSGSSSYFCKSLYGKNEYGYEKSWMTYINNVRVSKKYNDPGISYSEYKKIKNGMTYQEVTKLIGGQGIFYTSYMGYDIYIWYAEGYKGGLAAIEFYNGKVCDKTQKNLK